jgi:hypothetical protein
MSRVESTKGEGELSQRALRVVLQHWMIPNLGWNSKVLQETLSSLRLSIMSHRFKPPSDKETPNQDREDFLSHLENDVGYFDEDYGNLLKKNLNKTTPQSLLNTLRVPTNSQVCYYTYTMHNQTTIILL